MGRKKRKAAQLKPFCYYCSREFDDEKVLIQHQKAKHFKCSECNRKLDTATGLVVHMLQVHKITITRVPNADHGRDNPELIIHGMTGIPTDLLTEKQSKLDEERGAAKQRKSAHTVFGVSVMSGFLDQMQRPNKDRSAPTGPRGSSSFGSGPGVGGLGSANVLNSLLQGNTPLPGGPNISNFAIPPGTLPGLDAAQMNRLMAQMSQTPQAAAFNAFMGNLGAAGAVLPLLASLPPPPSLHLSPSAPGSIPPSTQPSSSQQHLPPGNAPDSDGPGPTGMLSLMPQDGAPSFSFPLGPPGSISRGPSQAGNMLSFDLPPRPGQNLVESGTVTVAGPDIGGTAPVAGAGGTSISSVTPPVSSFIGVSGILPLGNQQHRTAATTGLPSILSSTLKSASNRAGGRLMFEPSDESISPEEFKAAAQYNYPLRHDLGITDPASHQLGLKPTTPAAISAA